MTSLKRGFGAATSASHIHRLNNQVPECEIPSYRTYTEEHDLSTLPKYKFGICTMQPQCSMQLRYLFSLTELSWFSHWA